MSEVTICNLALSHLGDTAEVVSIKPPDSSVQAQLCSRFYYAARNALLEMHPWGFATRRVKAAEFALPKDHSGQPWRHVYAIPSGALDVFEVMPKDAPDDYEAWFGPVERDHFPPVSQGYLPVPGAPLVIPQPYVTETLADGSQVILTNVPEAVLRYTVVVSDTTKFTPLFTLALSHLLASQLAGPIMKGQEGAAEAKAQLAILETILGSAKTSDANQRKTRVEPAVSWIRGR